MAHGNDGLHQAYSPLQKASHWGLAVLCVLAFPTASAIQQAQVGRVFGLKASEFDLLLSAAHEWIGWLVLLLGALLLGSRFVQGAPALPTGMKRWQRALAYTAHAAIYFGLFALVASGATAMYFNGRFAFVHVQLSRIGIGLIALHLVAVVWHQLIRNDNLLGRLMPTRK